VVSSVSPVTTVLCTVKSTLNSALRVLKAFWKFWMPLYLVTGSWNRKSLLYLSVFSFCSDSRSQRLVCMQPQFACGV